MKHAATVTVTAPPYPQGPAALPAMAGCVRRSLAAGKTHAVFEADEAQDPFAVGIARRAGAAPGALRFRYAIDAGRMQAVLAGDAVPSAAG